MYGSATARALNALQRNQNYRLPREGEGIVYGRVKSVLPCFTEEPKLSSHPGGRRGGGHCTGEQEDFSVS